MRCTYDSERLGCSLRNLILDWIKINFLCSIRFDYTIPQCFIGVLIYCTISIWELKVFLSAWRHFVMIIAMVMTTMMMFLSHLTRRRWILQQQVISAIQHPTMQILYIYTPDAASQPSVCTEKTRVWSYRWAMGMRSTTCRRQPCLVVCIMVLHKSIFSGIMYRQHHTVYIES